MTNTFIKRFSALFFILALALNTSVFNLNIYASELDNEKISFDYTQPLSTAEDIYYDEMPNTLGWSGGGKFIDTDGISYNGIVMCVDLYNGAKFANVVYNIPEEAVDFEVFVFLDSKFQGTKYGTTEFQILIDDSMVFSKEITGEKNPPAEKVRLSLPENAKKITLQVEQEKGNGGDHAAVYGNPTFYKHTPTEGTIIKTATCAKEGIRQIKCSSCDEIIGEEAIPALTHIPNGVWNIVREPTCTLVGEQVQNCTLCGEVATTEQIALLSHSFGETKVVSGNKFLPPVVSEGVCQVCGTVHQTKDWTFVWLSPSILIFALFVVIIIRVSIKKNRFNRVFVCPYCQTKNHVVDIDFQCINPDCNNIFNSTSKRGKIPVFAACPKCHKHTSELICPHCRKVIPESSVFPKGR
jgi:hypothetical protein